MIFLNEKKNCTWVRLLEIDDQNTKSILILFFSGFRLKDFLNDNETLSAFLMKNASLTDNVVEDILMAEVNLEKVSS